MATYTLNCGVSNENVINNQTVSLRNNSPSTRFVIEAENEALLRERFVSFALAEQLAKLDVEKGRMHGMVRYLKGTSCSMLK